MVGVISNHDLDLLHVHYADSTCISCLYGQQDRGEKRRKNTFQLHRCMETDGLPGGAGQNPCRPVVAFPSAKAMPLLAVCKQPARRKQYKSFHIAKEIEGDLQFCGCKTLQSKTHRCLQGELPNGEKILVHASNSEP